MPVSSLIQPIRDLAQNWEVDVASRLEEYLTELEDVRITFDGGATTMNFAEAALLIQSSTCIYSRKVEYLYSLVYQAMDMIANKKKLLQDQPKDQDGVDEDVSIRSKEDEFLTLDDVRVSVGKTNNTTDEGDVTDANMNTLVRTPMALSSVEESEKADKTLVSRSAEILGSKIDYWMNRSLKDLNGSMTVAQLSTSKKSALTGLISFRGLDDKSTQNITGNQANDVDVDVMNVDANNEIPSDAKFNDDDDDAGAEFFDAPPSPDSPPQNQEVVTEETKRYGLRQRRVADALFPLKPTHDPWQKLDAHAADAAVVKTFKKLSTFRIPNKPAVKKRKKTPLKPKYATIDEFLQKKCFSNSEKFPSNPLKVPTFQEFEVAFWDEFKRRQAAVQLKKKKMLEEMRFKELQDLEEEQQEEEENAEVAEFAAANDDDDMDDIGEGIQFDDQVIGADTVQPMALEDVTLHHSSIIQTYEDLVRRHVELYLDQAQNYIQETDLSRRIKEWEEKIMPVLQQEEDRGPFDIHRYGSKILDVLLAEKNKTFIYFSEIVQNKEPYEICRLFLSTLQLANNLNVEIKDDKDYNEKSIDKMKLKLLSTHRHHEDLADYMAPSLGQK